MQNSYEIACEQALYGGEGGGVGVVSLGMFRENFRNIFGIKISLSVVCGEKYNINMKFANAVITCVASFRVK